MPGHPIGEDLEAWCPRPPRRVEDGWLLPRFPRAVREHLAGRVGPLANLESPSGCCLRFVTAAPRCTLRLAGLRHHQPIPVRCVAETREGNGWRCHPGEDLRDRRGEVAVPFELGPAGIEREVRLWLPCISRCRVVGVDLPAGCTRRLPPPLTATWLAVGDSVTQGFAVPAYTDSWVHRVMRRAGLEAVNLGLAGAGIDPGLFGPALGEAPFDLVTVGLGANHAWRAGGAAGLEERVDALLALLHPIARRCLWLLPPWKPCEDGLGPPAYAGVRLDAAAGARMVAVREQLAAHLADRHGWVKVVDGLLPRRAELLPDGVHPGIEGAALLAEGVLAALAKNGGAPRG